MEDGLIPLVVFIGGQLSTLTLTWLQARWRWNHERDAREQERRNRILDAHRETLLQLQESLYLLGLQSYFLVQVRWADATHGRYDETQRLECFQRAGMLRVRVMDEEIRRLAQEIRNGANEVYRAKTLADANAALTQQHDAYQTANERIGQMFRGELAATT